MLLKNDRIIDSKWFQRSFHFMYVSLRHLFYKLTFLYNQPAMVRICIQLIINVSHYKFKMFSYLKSYFLCTSSFLQYLLMSNLNSYFRINADCLAPSSFLQLMEINVERARHVALRCTPWSFCFENRIHHCALTLSTSNASIVIDRNINS